MSPLSRRNFNSFDAQLVAIKSPGTGKTELLESVVRDARCGQWVLVIGHRVQLWRHVIVGIPYITEVKSSETGAVLGYGLALTVYTRKSSAVPCRIGIMALCVDESESHLAHATQTLVSERVAILRELKPYPTYYRVRTVSWR